VDKKEARFVATPISVGGYSMIIRLYDTYAKERSAVFLDIPIMDMMTTIGYCPSNVLFATDT